MSAGALGKLLHLCTSMAALAVVASGCVYTAHSLRQSSDPDAPFYPRSAEAEINRRAERARWARILGPAEAALGVGIVVLGAKTVASPVSNGSASAADQLKDTGKNVLAGLFDHGPSEEH